MFYVKKNQLPGEPAYTEQFWTLEMVQSDRDSFARFSVRD